MGILTRLINYSTRFIGLFLAALAGAFYFAKDDIYLAALCMIFSICIMLGLFDEKGNEKSAK